MSERDYIYMDYRDEKADRNYLDGYDEDSIREIRAKLIRQRSKLNPITQQFDIEVYDLMIKELDEKYPNARFERKSEQVYVDSSIKKEKPKSNINISSFFSATLFSVLGLICFYVLGLIATLLGVLIKMILSYIPLLKHLAQFDIEYFAVVIAVVIVNVLCDKIIKNNMTKKFSIIIFGVLLTLVSLVFLILNILSGEGSILANIIQLIVGVIALYKGIKYSADTE